jgi:hypothetical protein
MSVVFFATYMKIQYLVNVQTEIFWTVKQCGLVGGQQLILVTLMGKQHETGFISWKPTVSREQIYSAPCPSNQSAETTALFLGSHSSDTQFNQRPLGQSTARQDPP